MQTDTDKRALTAAGAPVRLGCSRRMPAFHQHADCYKRYPQELYWLGLMGQSLTRKTLHYESERARTDRPYCGAVKPISTAFNLASAKSKLGRPKPSEAAALAARDKCEVA